MKSYGIGLTYFELAAFLTHWGSKRSSSLPRDHGDHIYSPSWAVGSHDLSGVSHPGLQPVLALKPSRIGGSEPFPSVPALGSRPAAGPGPHTHSTCPGGLGVWLNPVSSQWLLQTRPETPDGTWSTLRAQYYHPLETHRTQTYLLALEIRGQSKGPSLAGEAKPKDQGIPPRCRDSGDSKETNSRQAWARPCRNAGHRLGRPVRPAITIIVHIPQRLFSQTCEAFIYK